MSPCLSLNLRMQHHCENERGKTDSGLNDGKSERTDAENTNQTHGFSTTCQAFLSQKRNTDDGNQCISPRYIIPAVSLMTLSSFVYSGPGGKLSNSSKLSETNEGNCSPIALQLDKKTVA